MARNPNAADGTDGWDDFVLAASREDESEYCRLCGMELLGYGRLCPECDPEEEDDR